MSYGLYVALRMDVFTYQNYQVVMSIRVGIKRVDFIVEPRFVALMPTLHRSL